MWKLLIAGFAATLLYSQTAPPWSKGANNPAVNKGYVFQVADIDNIPDLHGNPSGAQLVLFVGGNQFFVLPELIAGFEKLHPELRGRIFYETLPPGILRKQMSNDNTLTLGNFTLQVQPDVYEAGARVLDQMAVDKSVERSVHYATNTLEIMVPSGARSQIKSLHDLGADRIRLSMPNPEWEGVSRQIADSLKKAGGDDLYSKVYKEKVRSGTTYLTHIHHRETPMRILSGESDAGVTWASEVRFQESIGNPISGVQIPAAQNITATQSQKAQTTYAKFGFGMVSRDTK
jgi:hypothetical protein